MNSSSSNYTNETKASPSTNVIPFSSKASPLDEVHLIEDGIYEAVLYTWQTTVSFGQPRLVMYFTITEYGKHLGKTFPKFYNVRTIKGRPKIKGNFIAKPKGDLLKHLYTIFPDCNLIRADRVPMHNLLKKQIKVKMKTVKTDYENNKYPKQMQYSIVDELIKI